MPYGMQPTDTNEVLTGKQLAVDAVTIRRAQPADALALRRLAELDGAVPLAGALLLAEIDGEPWAAVSLDDGRVVSDPFRPAAAARALLLLRADHLAPAAGRGGLRLRLPAVPPLVRRAWRLP